MAKTKKMAFGGLSNMGGPRGGMSPRGATTRRAKPAQMPINMAALSANPLGGTAGPIASVGSGRMKKGGKVKMSSASKRADGIAIRGKTRA